MPIIVVEHMLTEEEINERAKQLTKKMRERDDVEENKKDSVKEYNAEIKDYDKEIDKLARAIDTGKEDKNVDCIVEKDFDNKVIRYLDSITNELVKETPMSPAELQLSLQEDIENAENPESDIDEMEQAASAVDEGSESDDDLTVAEEPADEFSAATAAVGF